MAIICRRHGLLFIMTPRTACTAIGELLCNYYNGEFLPAEDILDTKGRIAVQKKHSTLAELIRYGLLARHEADSLLKVASVRNPFDTLVSLYIKQRLKYRPLLDDSNSWVSRSPTYAKNMRYAQTHSFNQWVLRKCRRQFLKRFFGFPPSMFKQYTEGADVILRYERIERDLKQVFEKKGMTVTATIPVTNRTDERTDRDYRSSYSRVATLAVALAYSGDLRSYGYEF